MEHEKQVRKRMKVTSASAHYSRLFSIKIADFLFAFHQSLNALKLEVVLLVKLRSKGIIANLRLIRVDQSKLVNLSKIRLKPQNQMCRVKFKMSEILCEKKNSECTYYWCGRSMVQILGWSNRLSVANGLSPLLHFFGAV